MSGYNSKRDRQRLIGLDQQLAEIEDCVLSVAIKQRIRETAHAYALWLEADDLLSELGLDVQLGGGIEFPGSDEKGVGVVTIEAIKLHTVTIERVTLEGDEP